jgi:hypothetical protein
MQLRVTLLHFVQQFLPMLIDMPVAPTGQKPEKVRIPEKPLETETILEIETIQSIEKIVKKVVAQTPINSLAYLYWIIKAGTTKISEIQKMASDKAKTDIAKPSTCVDMALKFAYELWQLGYSGHTILLHNPDQTLHTAYLVPYRESPNEYILIDGFIPKPIIFQRGSSTKPNLSGSLTSQIEYLGDEEYRLLVTTDTNKTLTNQTFNLTPFTGFHKVPSSFLLSATSVTFVIRDQDLAESGSINFVKSTNSVKFRSPNQRPYNVHVDDLRINFDAVNTYCSNLGVDTEETIKMLETIGNNFSVFEKLIKDEGDASLSTSNLHSPTAAEQETAKNEVLRPYLLPNQSGIEVFIQPTNHPENQKYPDQFTLWRYINSELTEYFPNNTQAIAPHEFHHQLIHNFAPLGRPYSTVMEARIVAMGLKTGDNFRHPFKLVMADFHNSEATTDGEIFSQAYDIVMYDLISKGLEIGQIGKDVKQSIIDLFELAQEEYEILKMHGHPLISDLKMINTEVISFMSEQKNKALPSILRLKNDSSYFSSITQELLINLLPLRTEAKKIIQGLPEVLK